jgi:hypothetical protein
MPRFFVPMRSMDWPGCAHPAHTGAEIAAHPAYTDVSRIDCRLHMAPA